MDPQTVEIKAKEISALMEERLRIRGRSLEHQLRRAGRLLPRWAQREGRYLADAQVLVQNPKLARMINETKVEKAHRSLTDLLKTFDPKDRAKARLLGVLGVISFNLILVFVGVVTFLWWRGIV